MKKETELFGITKGIVCQQVNCRYKYGAGLAGVIAKQYPVVAERYFENVSVDMFGYYDIIDLSDTLSVANLYTQLNYGNSKKTGIKYTDTDKLIECIRRIATINEGRTVYLPHSVVDGEHKGIGCGFAGESWDVVLRRVSELMLDNIKLINTFTKEVEEVPKIEFVKFWERKEGELL